MNVLILNFGFLYLSLAYNLVLGNSSRVRKNEVNVYEDIIESNNTNNKTSKIVSAEFLDYPAIGERPYQVALLDTNYRPFCSGVLIYNQVVLTVAHCVTDRRKFTKEIIVRYGTNNMRQGPVVNVKQSFVHPSFNRKSAVHDFALLILSSPVTLDLNVQTIKLNPYNDPVPGSSITLAGWRETSNNGTISESLLKAEFTIMDKVACAQIYADLRPLNDNMFCANSPQYSICKADTGSPATKDGSLVGLLSFVRPGCRKNIPGVYSSFKDDYIWVYHTFAGALQGLN